jgi:ligand-binding sensor domain-containing protein
MRTIYPTLMLQFYALFSFSQGAWTNYNASSGLVSNQASYVTCDTSNNIWVAFGGGTYGDGIAKFDGSTWTHYDTSNSNIPQNAINIIKADRQGNVWMSFLGGIANTYLHGLSKLYTPAHPDPSFQRS